MPGVSTNMIWVSRTRPTPFTRMRVVCTLGLTIATFAPTSALVSVDLPALGAPMMAQNPARVMTAGRAFLPPPPARPPAWTRPRPVPAHNLGPALPPRNAGRAPGPTAPFRDRRAPAGRGLAPIPE